MTGDVATAGTAGTDVTRAADGQREPTGPELSAEEGGVASAQAAPGAPAEAPSPAADSGQPADGQAQPADGQPDQDPPASAPAESAPAESGRPAGKPRPKKAPASGRTRSGALPTRGGRGSVLPARGTPAGDPSAAAAGTAAVRRRLARLGAPRGGGTNPVLEPLIKTVRATHPKVDVRAIERAYEVAARRTPARSAAAATRTSPTRSPWPRSWPSWA